jgi:hypothetical protein
MLQNAQTVLDLVFQCPSIASCLSVINWEMPFFVSSRVGTFSRFYSVVLYNLCQFSMLQWKRRGEACNCDTEEPTHTLKQIKATTEAKDVTIAWWVAKVQFLPTLYLYDLGWSGTVFVSKPGLAMLSIFYVLKIESCAENSHYLWRFSRNSRLGSAVGNWWSQWVYCGKQLLPCRLLWMVSGQMACHYLAIAA